MNINHPYPSTHPMPDLPPKFYVVHLKGDPAKEPLSVNESIPRAIADAAAKTGRPRSDHEVEEIPESRYQKLKEILGA